MLLTCWCEYFRISLQSEFVTMLDCWLRLYCSGETELRGRNNMTFPLETDTLNIRQWYNTWNQPETREAYISIPTGVGKIGKGLGFCLELFIHFNRVCPMTARNWTISNTTSAVHRAHIIWRWWCCSRHCHEHWQKEAEGIRITFWIKTPQGIPGVHL